MEWWADHHSVSQAIEFEETVVRQIATLAEMPERFGFAYENGNFEFELRQNVYAVQVFPVCTYPRAYG